MARPELGTKRQCQSCSAKFYDLGKTPIVCPKCETVFQAVQPRGSRPDPDDDADVVKTPEVETVPLEAVDGDAAKAEAVDTDVEAEETTDDEDNTFLEEDEEDGDDVSGLIDGEIEDDEEA